MSRIHLAHATSSTVEHCKCTLCGQSIGDYNYLYVDEKPYHTECAGTGFSTAMEKRLDALEERVRLLEVPR